MPDEKEEIESKEVDEGDKGGDEALSAIINVDDFNEEENKEDGDKEEKEEKGDKKEKVEKKEEKTDAEKAELIRKNADLNRALHEERQKNKKKDAKEEEVVLTDAQLLGLLDEYKDDKKTLLNVIKYQAQLAAKGAAKDTVSTADIQRKKKEAEDYLLKTYPDLAKDDSELRGAVNKTKENLDLNDHPYGELFGTAVTFLMSAPAILKNAYDKGRKDAEDGVAEKTRKELIKDGKLTPNKGDKGDKGAKGTPETRDIAAKLGLKSPQQIKLLEKLTASAKGTRTVSVEE
jgi:hypothetical protein